MVFVCSLSTAGHVVTTINEMVTPHRTEINSKQKSTLKKFFPQKIYVGFFYMIDVLDMVKFVHGLAFFQYYNTISKWFDILQHKPFARKSCGATVYISREWFIFYFIFFCWKLITVNLPYRQYEKRQTCVHSVFGYIYNIYIRIFVKKKGSALTVPIDVKHI